MKHEFTAAVACALMAFFQFATGDDSAYVTSGSPQPAVDSEAMIRSEFDRPSQARHLYVKHFPNSGGLELCGDICDFFAWKTSRNTLEVWDFVVLYEYQRGIGSQLEGVTETYKPRAEVIVPQLLTLYENYCPGHPNKDELLSCVLEKLANRNQIRIAFVNYDEGNRCLAWGDVRDRTKISNYQCVQVGGKRRSTK